MTRLWVVFAVFFLTAPASYAQTRADTLPEVRNEITPLGIRYARAVMAGAEKQSIQIYWRESSLKTNPDNFWIYMQAGRMIAAGPAGSNREDFTERLKDLQSGFSFNFLPDAAHLGVNIKPENATEVGRLIGAMLTDPALPRGRFERTRDQIAQGLDQELEKSEALAGKLWLRRMVVDAAVGPALSRDSGLVAKGSRDALRDWMRRTLTRDNMVVATAGPMDAAKAGALVDALVGGLPATGIRSAAPKLAFQQPTGMVTLQKAVPQTILMIGGPANFDEDRDEALFLAATQPLYHGLKSRAYANLREKLGAAYGVQGFVERLGEGGLIFGLRAAVDHARAVAAFEGLKDEYARWREGGITEDEFNDARATFMARLPDQARRAPFVAGAMGRSLLRFDRADPLSDRMARLKSMTRDEVNAFIKRAFPPAPLTAIVVAPDPAQFGAACSIKTVAEVTGCK